MIDSNDAHAEAWARALREHGIDADRATIRPFIGMGGDKLLPAVARLEENSDTPYDIEAAARAGVRAIALRCGGHWPDSALGGAMDIFDDPTALLTYLRTRRDGS